MKYTYKYHRDEWFLFITNIQLSDKKIHIIVSLKIETFLELCHKLFYKYIKLTQVFKIKKASDFWYIILFLLWKMCERARVFNIVFLNV